MVKRHSLDYIKRELLNKRIIWLNENEGYKNLYSNLHLKCKKNKCGYSWYTNFNNIRSDKYGCHRCSKTEKFDFDEVDNMINRKNIIWLDRNKGYNNPKNSLLLKCKKCNHIWNNSFGNLHYRTQKCPKCTGFAKPSLDDIHTLLTKKSIIWMDNNRGYENSGVIYLFKCLLCKYEWKTSFDCVKNRNTGCPNCASCKTEKLCRKYLEYKFKVPFQKLFPKWLNGLQLDGYNEQLNLAFEYNGKQHYEYIKHFHKSKKEFITQQQRDILKRKILKEKGVHLIDIPYNYDHKKEKKLYEFIDAELEKLNISR